MGHNALRPSPYRTDNSKKRASVPPSGGRKIRANTYPSDNSKKRLAQNHCASLGPENDP